MREKKPQKPEGHNKKKGSLRKTLALLLLGIAVVFALPFAVKRDTLPPALRNNKAVTSYYNRTHGLMHKADEKIDASIEDLHKKAQGENASPAPAPDDAAQTGYTRSDRDKLDALITKGETAP